ncbi:hypothetical protein [Microbispora corallina]|uniref:hypothetical protein n=1 Tax=Microbispora corallina TaxID=83302 RepID=UPI0019515729|nr:hypothetical protein [Microbispora corallina]
MVPVLGGVLLWVAIFGCALLRSWSGDRLAATTPQADPFEDAVTWRADDHIRARWTDEDPGEFQAGEHRADGFPTGEGAAPDARADRTPRRRGGAKSMPAATIETLPAGTAVPARPSGPASRAWWLAAFPARQHADSPARAPVRPPVARSPWAVPPSPTPFA